MKQLIKYSLTVFFLLLFNIARPQSSIENAIPKPMNPPRLVNDFAQLLMPSQDDALEQKLVAYNDSTSTQIAIVIVHSVGQYDMEQFALTILRKWGVGSKKNNGVVLLIASDDHKVFIATGYGIEGALPDVICKRIIDNDIVPNFKEQKYYTGIDQATDDMILAAAGEYKAPPKKDNNGGNIIGIIIFVLIIIFIISRINRGGGGGGMVSRGGFWTGALIGTMLGGGLGGRGGGDWGGGGGFGGGGFGGFGGGSGGGGGAGGGW